MALFDWCDDLSARAATLARRVGRFGFGLSVRGLEAVGKLGLYTLAVAWLGESPAGLFFLALTVLHLTATVCRLGTERILARNVAAYIASGQAREARQMIISGLALNGAVAGVGGLILWAGAAPIARIVLGEPAMAPLLGAVALALPAQVVAYAAGYILIGLERGGLAQLLMNALPPAIALGVLALGVGSAEGALMAYAIACVACAGVALAAVGWSWRRVVVEQAHRREDHLPGLFSGLRSFYWVELIQAALIGAPVVAVAHVATSAEVGAFSLAARLSMVILTIVISLGAMSAAELAATLRRGDAEGLTRAMRRLAIASAAVCLPAIAVLIVLGPFILGRLGVTVPGAPIVLAMLALSQLPFALAPARDVLLSMGGEDRVLRNISMVQAVMMLAGCLVLAPLFGFWGVVVMTTATWAFGPIACHIVARRHIPQAFGAHPRHP